MFRLGAPELVILLVLAATLLLPVWGVVDAATRPEQAFTAAGQNKTLWIILNGAGILVCGVGAVLAVVYLAAIRPRVAAAGSPPRDGVGRNG